MGDPKSKPQAMIDPPKPRTVNRYYSSGTTSECTPATAVTASPKLEELKLAFCLLDREIQDLDRGVGEKGPSSCAPDATNVSSAGDKAGGRVSISYATGTNSAAAPAAPATAAPVPAAGRAAAVGRGAAAVMLSTPFPCLLAGVPGVSASAEKATGVAASSVAVHPKSENPLPTTMAQLVSHHCCCDPTSSRERMQAVASGVVGRKNATGGTDRDAKKALEQLQAELDAERRSRMAAESALQDLRQRAAAESDSKPKKLARAVGSSGERSSDQLTTGSERILERRLREAEGALAASKQLAQENAGEAAEALEKAAALAEALEAEKAARVTAVNARRNATLDLRACLRGRAKAEEEAASTAAALKKSEATAESLAQRLEVLRAANRRLKKRATAAAAYSSATGIAAGVAAESGGNITSGGSGNGATDTGDRLAAARARLRTLSAGKMNGGTDILSGHAEGRAERAALDRALSNVAADKKWKDKLREMEARGESYKSAAQTAEMGMQQAVREKEELEGVNRSLARRLAEISENQLVVNGKDSGRRIKRTAEPQVDLAGGGVVAAEVGVRETGLVSDGGQSHSRRDDAQQAGANSSSGDTGRGTCTVFGPAPLCCSRGPSPAKRSWVLAGTGDATAAVTGALLTGPCRTPKAGLSGERSGSTVSESAARQEDGGHPDETAKEAATPPPPTRSTIFHVTRSDGIDNTYSKMSPPTRCGNGQARPRSASEGSPSRRQDTSQSMCGRKGAAARNDGGDSSAIYSRLLSESRQLREEVLSAVRRRPWLEGDQARAGGGGGGSSSRGGIGWGDSTTSLKLRSHPPEENLEVTRAPFADGAKCGVPPDSKAVTTVPIAVLLRLCERGARGVKCVDADKVTRGKSEETKNTAGESNVGDRTVECARESASPGRRARGKEPAREEEPEAEETATLPQGVTPSLARQVQGAVSRGDEHGFLQIVGQCDSAARGGIAQLLSIETP